MKYFKIISISIVVILIIIQFFRIDKTNPETIPEKDFLISTKAPQEISNMIKTSCYDCHSNETVYPWYSNLAPISWMLSSHIEEARGTFNFSEWGDYTYENKIAIFEGCIEMIEEREMPLGSYTLIHSDAKLSDHQISTLTNWFKLQEGSLNKTDTVQ